MKYFYLLLLLVTVGCSTHQQVESSLHIGKQAASILIDTDNKPIGKVVYTQGSQGVLIEITASNLPPGKHGLHFHETGACTAAKGFKTADGHIMPDGKPHGFLYPKGPHAGNLPNLVVHQDGTVHVELYTSLILLYGQKNRPALLDQNGSTLIIHTNPDDHQTQPIGGSGSRIACGVLSALE